MSIFAVVQNNIITTLLFFHHPFNYKEEVIKLKTKDKVLEITKGFIDKEKDFIQVIQASTAAYFYPAVFELVNYV